jgi:hypothetical protein
MGVALSLDLDLAKFHESCFHFSIFRWLDLQGNDAMIRVYDGVGIVIETHELRYQMSLSLAAHRKLGSTPQFWGGACIPNEQRR